MTQQLSSNYLATLVPAARGADYVYRAGGWKDDYAAQELARYVRELCDEVDRLRGQLEAAEQHVKILRESVAAHEPPASLFNHMFTWIHAVPHSDNCFVRDEYPGNTCVCGKESLMASIEEYRAAQPPRVEHRCEKHSYAGPVECELCTGQPPRVGRTNEDYAIEHGRYLATAAEQFLSAVEKLDEAEIAKAEAVTSEEDDGAEIALRDASESRSDHWQALRSAIYEFRKRADRATATKGAAT